MYYVQIGNFIIGLVVDMYHLNFGKFIIEQL